jgi:hypothetical protein
MPPAHLVRENRPGPVYRMPARTANKRAGGAVRREMNPNVSRSELAPYQRIGRAFYLIMAVT